MTHAHAQCTNAHCKQNLALSPQPHALPAQQVRSPVGLLHLVQFTAAVTPAFHKTCTFQPMRFPGTTPHHTTPHLPLTYPINSPLHQPCAAWPVI